MVHPDRIHPDYEAYGLTAVILGNEAAREQVVPEFKSGGITVFDIETILAGLSLPPEEMMDRRLDAVRGSDLVYLAPTEGRLGLRDLMMVGASLGAQRPLYTASRIDGLSHSIAPIPIATPRQVIEYARAGTIGEGQSWAMPPTVRRGRALP